MKLVIVAIVLLGAVSIHAAEQHQGHVRFGEVSVPGVSVQATQGDRTLRAVTDADGRYVLPNVEGTWSIQVEMPGFGTLRQDLIMATESPTEWDLKLKPIGEIDSEQARGFAKESVSTLPALQVMTPSPEAAKGLLINGSVSNGAATSLGLARGFGNNRLSGRSPYKGSVTVNANNALFNARSYSLTGLDTPRPDYSRLNSSIVLTGPLQIPHLFKKGQFALTFGRTQNRNASIQSALLPTAAERAGDFSASSKAPIDPESGLPFASGVIPQDRISSQARVLESLFPLPNFTGSTRYNYQVPVVGVTHGDNLQMSVSGFRFGRDTFSGAATISSLRSDNPSLMGFTDTSNTKSLSSTLTWVHRFSARIAANVRYSFNRNVAENLPYFANRVDVSGIAGIIGNDRDPRNWGPPELNFARGIASLSTGSYALNRTQSHTIGYTSTWVYRRHAFGYGVDHQWYQYNLFAQSNARGVFTFTGAETGNDFADFLLGVPTTSSLAFGNADKYFRQSTSNAYLTDDFRVLSKLTVNAGVRWEYESPITERYGRLVNLAIAPDFFSATPVIAGDKRNSLVRPHRSLIQPRIGLAWRPWTNRSAVIRLGYGIYQDTNVYRAIADQMSQQSPLSKSLSVQNTPANPLTLADGFRGSPAVTATTFAVDPNFRPGTAQNWTLSVAQNLPSLMQVTLTYLGIKGTHVPRRFLPNTAPAGTSNPCAGCPAGFVYLASNGNTNRHSGTIELRRRQRNGFEFGGVYTFAKAIDDAGLGGANYIAQDWLNFRAERGLSNFDQRHQFTAQGQFTSGMFVNSSFFENGWKGRALKEWTISSEFTIGSGSPLTPMILAPVQGTGVTGTLRPNLTGAPIFLSNGGAFLNPGAFAAPAPGEWGNAGRNSVIGPGQLSLNASLSRGFHLTDRISMDLRIIAANVLNHVTFAGWNTTLNSAQFGLPIRPNTMRTIQPSMVVRW